MGSRVLVLDYGSQYNQLIIRCLRELGVYAELRGGEIPLAAIRAFEPSAVILSGGPASVYDQGSPTVDKGLWTLGLPVLGICYGMQLMVHELGGRIAPSADREYGKAMLRPGAPSAFLAGVQGESQVWMSHGDSVAALPPGFATLASTAATPHAVVHDPARRFFGVQFHPEVRHTLEGKTILRNFLFGVCKLAADWNMGDWLERAIPRIREQVGEDRVVLGLSGGVDSSVMAALLGRALGERATCIFIDNGLLRLGEREKVEAAFRGTSDLSLVTVDASALFLGRLSGKTDPEEKRKIIGAAFIEAFEAQIKRQEDAKWLAQGTIYPDVIESMSTHGRSVTIKSHHNVGGLPERMRLKILEPLRELFKDEVRELGRRLGLPASITGRHPFPGPGLGVRVVGEVTRERCDVLRRADAIFLEEIEKAGLYDRISQALAVLLPVKSVGVMGDGRTYEQTLVLRAVVTSDFMTADWFRFPPEVLAAVSNRIVGEVRGVNRVLYDVTSKPPATIEWE